MKSTFSGLQFCHWQYGSLSISIRLDVLLSSKCTASREIPRKFELIAVQGLTLRSGSILRGRSPHTSQISDTQASLESSTYYV